MAGMPMELFLSDEVQTLLDDFASLLDVRVTFYSMSGERLRRGKEMRNCSYCQLVHDELGGYERCVSMDCDKQREEGPQHCFSFTFVIHVSHCSLFPHFKKAVTDASITTISKKLLLSRTVGSDSCHKPDTEQF